MRLADISASREKQGAPATTEGLLRLLCAMSRYRQKLDRPTTHIAASSLSAKTEPFMDGLSIGGGC